MQMIEHQGRTILYFDYKGLDDNDLVRQIWENEKGILALIGQGKGDLLRLTDIRGCYASPEIMEAFKAVAIKVAPYFKASAVVGVTGGKKVLLEMINRFSGLGVRPFNSVEEAKDWLVVQAMK